jgi:hypothetical protein
MNFEFNMKSINCEKYLKIGDWYFIINNNINNNNIVSVNQNQDLNFCQKWIKIDDKYLLFIQKYDEINDNNKILIEVLSTFDEVVEYCLFNKKQKQISKL